MAVSCPHLCQHLLCVRQRKGVPAGAGAVGCRPQRPGRPANGRRLCATLCLARPFWLHALLLCCTQVLRFLPCHCVVISSCLSGSFSGRQALLSSHTEGHPCRALLGTLCLAGCSLLSCIQEAAPGHRRRAGPCMYGGVLAFYRTSEETLGYLRAARHHKAHSVAAMNTMQGAGRHTCQATPCQGATVRLPALPDGGPSPLTLRPGQVGVGAARGRWHSPALQPMLGHPHPRLTHRQAALMQRWANKLTSSSWKGDRCCCKAQWGTCAPGNYSLLQWVFAASC